MDNDTKHELPELRARLEEAQKSMDNIISRELSAFKWLGGALAIVSTLFVGFQVFNTQRLDAEVKRLEERVQKSIESAKKDVENAIGQGKPSLAEIKDAMNDPSVFEFIPQIVNREGGPRLILEAPYYVSVEGAVGGLIGINYSIEGEFLEALSEKAWRAQGSMSKYSEYVVGTGHLEIYDIKDYYNSHGVVILPEGIPRRFFLSYHFPGDTCNDIVSLYHQLRDADLGSITIEPVLSSAENIRSSKYKILVLDDPHYDCLD